MPTQPPADESSAEEATQPDYGGRAIGFGEGYGSGELPTTIRGIAVQGSDSFYVQKLDRLPRDAAWEAENGYQKMSPCCGEDEEMD